MLCWRKMVLLSNVNSSHEQLETLEGEASRNSCEARQALQGLASPISMNWSAAKK